MGAPKWDTGAGQEQSKQDQSPITDEQQIEPVSEERSPTSGDTSVQQPTSQPRVDVDDPNVIAGYINFCRISSTPEELILDLGVNP